MMQELLFILEIGDMEA